MRARLELQITTIDPVHITAPEKDLYYNIKTKKLSSFSKGDGNFPVTPTRKMTFAETFKDSDGRVSVPVIPANTLRGGLRRSIASIYADKFEADGKMMSLDAFHCLTTGSPHGNPDSFTSIENLQRYQNDLYYGLMGGGPKLGMASQLRVRAGYPICPSTSGQAGLTMINPSIIKELDCADTDWVTILDALRKKDDACRQHISFDAKRIVKDLGPSVDAFEQAINANKSTEDGESSSRGLNGLFFIEAIAPKTPIFLRYDLVHTQEMHIGLFLLGLQRFLQQPIGGKSAIGYGNFVVTHAGIEIDQEKSLPATTAPETWDDWFSQKGVVGRCVQAAKEQIAQLDLAEVEELARPEHIGKKPKKSKEDKGE